MQGTFLPTGSGERTKNTGQASIPAVATQDEVPTGAGASQALGTVSNEYIRRV